jgi:hypothetical protein
MASTPSKPPNLGGRARARVAARKPELLKSEIRQDLEACNAYAAKHGSFAEMVLEHDREADDES